MLDILAGIATVVLIFWVLKTWNQSKLKKGLRRDYYGEALDEINQEFNRRDGG